jgi:hypothetical protein
MLYQGRDGHFMSMELIKKIKLACAQWLLDSDDGCGIVWWSNTSFQGASRIALVAFPILSDACCRSFVSLASVTFSFSFYFSFQIFRTILQFVFLLNLVHVFLITICFILNNLSNLIIFFHFIPFEFFLFVRFDPYFFDCDLFLFKMVFKIHFFLKFHYLLAFSLFYIKLDLFYCYFFCLENILKFIYFFEFIPHY